ncbi:MAG TPA: hypothetical protein VG819_05740 [Rhizomicrobium sp.]|nr:hypothetical protein [Rhizomicrobium sp.]
MKKATILIALALCVPVVACKPHPGKLLRGGERIERQQERAGRHHGLKRACRDDLGKFCASAEKGRARRACLQDHLSELSAGCKSAVEARGRKGGRKNRDTDNDDSDD